MYFFPSKDINHLVPVVLFSVYRLITAYSTRINIDILSQQVQVQFPSVHITK